MKAKKVSTPKKVQFTKKVMPTIFWDCKGILFTAFKKRNTTVNETYCAAFPHKLRQNIRKKLRGLTRGMHLLHDGVYYLFEKLKMTFMGAISLAMKKWKLQFEHILKINQNNIFFNPETI